MKKFVCSVCGYVHTAEELAADFKCPVCKVPASKFVEQQGEQKNEQRGEQRGERNNRPRRFHRRPNNGERKPKPNNE